MRTRFLNRNTVLFISFGIALLDQLSKFWANENVKEGTLVQIVPHILQIRVVKNTGAAFSLFSGATPLLALLSLVVATILFIWIWRNAPIQIWKAISISFLLGGSIGNGLDRWRLGYVTDFIELVPFDFPIFNGADIAINLAVLFFILDSMSKQNVNN